LELKLLIMKLLGIALLIFAVLLLLSCTPPVNQEAGMQEGHIEVVEMKILSPDFGNNKNIPIKFTCDGEDVNPELIFSNIPAETQTLILYIDDPDAPAGTWIHWLLYDIPVISKIPENTVPSGATKGRSSWNKLNYGGPCPPQGTHRYFFKLIALDKELYLDEGSSIEQVKVAMKDHVLAEAELIGLYARKN
jgi:Raf kinase inhibitor-like YbhB/YbcL family protein